MDLAQKVYAKLEKILTRLKALQIIHTFELKINFCHIEESMKVNLKEIDTVLKKCLKKIITRPKRAEIRNVITELVRRKNLNASNEQTFKKRATTLVLPGSKLEKLQEPSKFKKDILTHLKVNRISTTQPEKTVPHQAQSKLLKYFCDFCEESFSEIQKLKIHKREHSSIKVVECHHCLSSFSSAGFNEHSCVTDKSIKKNHAGTEITSTASPLSSGDVSEQANSKNTHQVIKSKTFIPGLRISRERPSSKGKPLTKENNPPGQFVCECGKIFRLRKSLKKHESIKHSKNSVLQSCTFCSKTFYERGKLNRHMLSHKNSQLQCSECLKHFTRSDALRRHIAVTHGRREQFPCSFCQKKFSFKYNRDVHEENQHRNTNNWLQCDQCGQKFRNKITLKSHMRIHSENRITCSICSKPFTRKIHYKKHLKNKHFGISPFQTLLDSVVTTDEIAS